MTARPRSCSCRQCSRVVEPDQLGALELHARCALCLRCGCSPTVARCPVVRPPRTVGPGGPPWAA